MASIPKPARWVVLLRGVNVGGANTVPMAELRAACAAAGFDDVATHIQSGNVVLDADDTEAGVAERVRTLMDADFGLAVPVVVRSAAELATVPDRHPGVGGPVAETHLHVLFLDRPADPSVVIDPARFLPDTFVVDGRHVHLTYPSGSGRSKLTLEVFERAHGVTATARNLNTVRALVALAG